jgi:hypothetical protein
VSICEYAEIQLVLHGHKTWHNECGDALDILEGIPAGSVHMICTSPPY